MKHKQALLLGSYGQTNLGDDVLMYNYLELLHGAGYSVIANTSGPFIPEAVKERFPELTYVDTYETSIWQWIRTIIAVDAVFYGGGTIFKELYATTGRRPYAVIARMAIFNLLCWILRKPVYNLHIGIGTLQTFIGKLLTKIALASSRYTIFRDKKSYDTAVRTLGISDKRVCLGTDGIFTNEIWQEPWDIFTLPIDGSSNRPVIGINVLREVPDWVDKDRYIHSIATLINHLVSQHYTLILIPFQHEYNVNNDYIFMQKEILPRLVKRDNVHLLGQLPLDQASSLISQLDLFIVMRFHAMLLSVTTGTPFFAIEYDTKCSRFIEAHAYPYSVRIEDMEPEVISQKVDAALADTPNIQELIEDIRRTNYALAEKGLDHVFTATT